MALEGDGFVGDGIAMSTATRSRAGSSIASAQWRLAVGFSENVLQEERGLSRLSDRDARGGDRSGGRVGEALLSVEHGGAFGGRYSRETG